MCLFSQIVEYVKSLKKSNHGTKADQNIKCKPGRSIVVTGYGPYRGITINPSWEAVKILKNLWDKDTKNHEVRFSNLQEFFESY